jgi:hypothetical protein
MTLQKAKWLGLTLFLLEAVTLVTFIVMAYQRHPQVEAPRPIATPTTYGYPSDK